MRARTSKVRRAAVKLLKVDGCFAVGAGKEGGRTVLYFMTKRRGKVRDIPESVDGFPVIRKVVGEVVPAGKK